MHSGAALLTISYVTTIWHWKCAIQPEICHWPLKIVLTILFDATLPKQRKFLTHMVSRVQLDIILIALRTSMWLQCVMRFVIFDHQFTRYLFQVAGILFQTGGYYDVTGLNNTRQYPDLSAHWLNNYVHNSSGFNQAPNVSSQILHSKHGLAIQSISIITKCSRHMGTCTLNHSPNLLPPCYHNLHATPL